jgi:hypothetical protein
MAGSRAHSPDWGSKASSVSYTSASASFGGRDRAGEPDDGNHADQHVDDLGGRGARIKERPGEVTGGEPLLQDRPAEDHDRGCGEGGFVHLRRRREGLWVTTTSVSTSGPRAAPRQSRHGWARRELEATLTPGEGQACRISLPWAVSAQITSTSIVTTMSAHSG